MKEITAGGSAVRFHEETLSVSLFKTKQPSSVLILSLSFVAVFLFNANAALVILLCAALGLIVYLFRRKAGTAS